MRGKGPAEEGTLYQYRQHLNLHIMPRLGGIKLASLTKANVEGFCDDLLENMVARTGKKLQMTNLTPSSAAPRNRRRAWRGGQYLYLFSVFRQI